MNMKDIPLMNAQNDSYKFKDVLFENVDLEGPYLRKSHLGNIVYFLQGDKNYNKIKFDDNIILYEYSESSYFLEYNSKDKRNLDISLFIDNYKMKTKHHSIKEEDGNQFPELGCTFDRDGKYYCFINAKWGEIDDINSDKGIYKGIIVNPEKYLKIYKSAEKVSGEVEGILLKIKKLIIK